jgi:hypothetical protein
MDQSFVYFTPSTVLNRMNDRIFARQIGSNPATVPLSQIPASTRREINRSETPNHSVKHQLVQRWYSATGTPEPSYAGYASNVGDESNIRGSDTPLTKCLLNARYQPTASSDMYNNWSQPPLAIPTHSDKAQEMPTGLVSSTEAQSPYQTNFNNHTRQQTKS